MKQLTAGSILCAFLALASCQSESDDPQVDCGSSSLAITLNSTTDADCDQSNGTISVSASGGTGNYTFSISGAPDNTNGDFDGLAAGTYSVTVRDGDCSRQLNATIENVGGVIITDVALTEAGCGQTNGSITVTADEGTPPYEYALGNSAGQSNNVFAGLSHGSYTVQVSDANDCEFTQEVQVLSGISWENEVSAIITNNCALPSCHGGSQNPDFREFTNVQSNAANIKARTQNGSMPPNATLSQEQIQAIACWVDDGALDN